MHIAALSDIHRNLPALEAVLRDIPEDVHLAPGRCRLSCTWPCTRRPGTR
jgi:hypothetical protein